MYVYMYVCIYIAATPAEQGFAAPLPADPLESPPLEYPLR